jgi:hypothetical protein
MISYSHAMTCLMTYHTEKRTEAISIVLQAMLYLLIDNLDGNLYFIDCHIIN